MHLIATGMPTSQQVRVAPKRDISRSLKAEVSTHFLELVLFRIANDDRERGIACSICMLMTGIAITLDALEDVASVFFEAIGAVGTPAPYESGCLSRPELRERRRHQCQGAVQIAVCQLPSY